MNTPTLNTAASVPAPNNLNNSDFITDPLAGVYNMRLAENSPLQPLVSNSASRAMCASDSPLP